MKKRILKKKRKKDETVELLKNIDCTLINITIWLEWIKKDIEWISNNTKRAQ